MQPRLAGEDAEDPVGAEPALAPAHARAGVVLDAVERGVPLADGLDHLGLGHALAPAHHVAVRGVPGDQGLPLIAVVLAQTLGPADAEALTAALAAYGSGEREHACPLCGSSHDFPHALACERAEGVFARSARPVLSAWRAAATGRIALLPGASWSAVPLPSSAVVWLGNVAIAWRPDGTHQILVPDGGEWRPRDLETVWPGMERDRVTGILVATCSVEGAEATR